MKLINCSRNKKTQAAGVSLRPFLDSSEQNHESPAAPFGERSLSNLQRLQCYLQLGGRGLFGRRPGGERLLREKSHFPFSLLLYSEWKCLLIRATVQRTSNHHISIGLAYVIIQIGFFFVCLLSLENQRGWEFEMLWSAARSRTRWDLSLRTFVWTSEGWCLLRSFLLLSEPSVCCPAVDFWRSVFALHSLASIYTFYWSCEKKNSWKEVKWSSDKSDTK